MTCWHDMSAACDPGSSYRKLLMFTGWRCSGPAVEVCGRTICSGAISFGPGGYFSEPATSNGVDGVHSAGVQVEFQQQARGIHLAAVLGEEGLVGEAGLAGESYTRRALRRAGGRIARAPVV
jgi:hypothetical protein